MVHLGGYPKNYDFGLLIIASTSDAANCRIKDAMKHTFTYVITIEGESDFKAFGATDKEEPYIRESVERLADDIQSFWQVKLGKRKVNIKQVSNDLVS